MADVPRIFISHAWEDKPLVKRLETELQVAGAEVWVDHSEVRGGHNLPKRISDALEWCSTLLLIWSENAQTSDWVELEWTNALSMKKDIIPCLLPGATVPGILRSRLYIDFQDIDEGITGLLSALELATPDSPPRTGRQTREPTIRKPQSVVKLRSQPINDLYHEAVTQMLKERAFFDADMNKDGTGLAHQYESVQRQGAKLVIDHATGLTWQQSGSGDDLSYEKAEAYIRELNGQEVGGYNDWRLPTLEEAMSLMEREQKHGVLYIDPVFDERQLWIWTADKKTASVAWVVNFNIGDCYGHDVRSTIDYVRAVR